MKFIPLPDKNRSLAAIKIVPEDDDGLPGPLIIGRAEIKALLASIRPFVGWQNGVVLSDGEG